MNKTTLTLRTPRDFDFWRTVYSHGWCSLPPFRVDKERKTLNRILSLDNGTVVQCSLAVGQNSSIEIAVASPKRMTSGHTADIARLLASSLRLTEDYSEFYAETKRYPKYRWISAMKTGRLLRAPSVFEDIVKMICTTNCSWALTESMTRNLVGELGSAFDETLKDFPSPAALAGVSEQFLRKNIRAGYRSPFLLEFAEKVAAGKLDVEAWRSSSLPTGAMFKELRSIKGVGEYAAGNILKLLGRYDYLGLDSWVRAQYYSLYHKGRKVSDRTINRKYEPFGQWRGLIFWMEMTKHWLKREFPF